MGRNVGWLGGMLLAAILVLSILLPMVEGTITVIDVLTQDTKYSALIHALQLTGLIPEFNRYNGTTLFAPSNEAFARLETELLARGVMSFSALDREEQRQILRYHTLGLRIESESESGLYHTHMVPVDHALAGEAQMLRVEFCRDGSLLVGHDDLGNGGIKAGPQFYNATDGKVFGIDRILTPPSSLAMLIRTLPELRRWREILPAFFIDQLRYQPHLTAFLPTNHAFGESDTIEYEDSIGLFTRHISGAGLSGGLVGYSNHITEDEILFRTVAGSSIRVRRSQTMLEVFGAKNVVRQDILASNGVLHLIDTILPNRLHAAEDMPRFANGTNSILTRALIDARASKFLKLIQTADLASWLEELIKQQHYTILAPRDDVLDDLDFPWNLISGDLAPVPLPEPLDSDLPMDVDDAPSERRAIVKIVKYHLLPGVFKPEDLEDAMLIESELRPRELSGLRQKVRVTLNHNAPVGLRLGNGDVTFGDAGVIAEPIAFEQGIIYLLSNLLEPPQDAITVFIRDAPRLSTFIAAVYAANLAPVLRSTPAVTCLVPTNYAFSKLGLVETYLLLPQARAHLRELVRFHALNNVTYLTSFKDGSHRFPTLSGEDLYIERTSNGSLYVHNKRHHDHSTASGTQDGRILEGDRLLSTGVMHIVDQVLMPSSIKIGVKELLIGGDADTFLDMLRLGNMTWVLNATTCDTDLLAKHFHVAFNMDTPCVPAFTIFAPTDKAFTQTNLTDLFDDRSTLLKVIRQHIVPGSVTALRDGIELRTMLSDPYTEDGVSQSAFEASEYGGLFLRRVGPSPFDFLIGVKGAHSSGGLEGQFGARHEWAKVLSGGKTTDPVGGALFVIDNVIWPYRPTWWERWRQAIGLAFILTMLAILIVFGLYKIYRRRQDRGSQYMLVQDLEED